MFGFEKRPRRSRVLQPLRHQYLPAEAINDRIEHLDCSSLSFPNLTNDINRSLLEAGRFRNPHTLLR